MNTELSTKLNLNYNFDEYDTFDDLIKVQDEVKKFNKAITKYTNGFVQSFLVDFSEVEKNMNEHSIEVYNKYLNFVGQKMEDVITTLSISMVSNINYCYIVPEKRKYTNAFKINEWFLKVENYLKEMSDENLKDFLEDLERNVEYFIQNDVLFEPYDYTYDEYSDYEAFSDEDNINCDLVIADSFCVVPFLDKPKYNNNYDGFTFVDTFVDYNRLYALEHNINLSFDKKGVKQLSIEICTTYGDY